MEDGFNGLPKEVLINLARTERLDNADKEQLLTLLSKGLSDEESKEFLAVIKGKKLPSLSSDVIAKKIFDPNEHPDRLEYLLQTAFKDETIKVAGPAKSEGYVGFVDSKKIVFDIAAELKDGRMTDTEIQVKAQDYIFPRMELYGSDMLMIQYSAKSGEKGNLNYENVQGVLVLVLMAESPKIFKQYKTERYIHRFGECVADSGLKCDPLRRTVYVQLDRAYDQFTSDEDGEENERFQLLMAAMKNINNILVQEKMRRDPFFSGILDEVRQMAQDKGVQIMLLAEKYAMADIVTMRDTAEKTGEERLKKLYRYLASQGRDDEWKKAMDDPAYCDALLRSLNL